MRSVTAQNFGLLAAYILPGMAVLWGASRFSPTLQRWLGAIPGESATVGGFLYVTLASVALGMFVQTVRWLVIDTIHHATGIRRPELDFSRLRGSVAAYEFFNEQHYRFYQYHSGGVVALAFVYLVRRIETGNWNDFGVVDLGYVAVAAVL